MALPIVAIAPIVEKGIDLSIEILKRMFPAKAQELEDLKMAKIEVHGQIILEKRKNPSDQNDALIEKLMFDEDRLDEKIAVIQDSAAVELAKLLNSGTTPTQQSSKPATNS